MTKEEAIRNEILEKAELLFQRHGYHKTTIEDIAKAVRKGKSSLYHYYSSKDDIYISVVKKIIAEVSNKLVLAVDSESTASGKLTAFITTKHLFMNEKVMLFDILTTEISSDFILYKKTIEMIDSFLVKTLRGILDFGYQTSEFNFESEDDIDFTAKILNYSLQGIDLKIMNKTSKSEELSPVFGQKLARFFLSAVKPSSVKE